VITKTDKSPAFIISYSPDHIVVNATGKEIKNAGYKSVCDVIREHLSELAGKDFKARQKAIKILQPVLLSKIEESMGSIMSDIPRDMGRKISGIVLKQSIKEATTLELTFSKLTIEEADNICFSRGATFRLWGGYFNQSGTRDVDLLFEGCVQNVQTSYDQAGITKTLLLASHKYTKVAYLLTPFDIFNYFDYKYYNVPADRKERIKTFKEFLFKGVSKYLDDCPITLHIRTKDKKLNADIKAILGFDETPEKLAVAYEFWGMVRTHFTQGKLVDTLTTEIHYPLIKDILDFVAGLFSFNWFFDGFGGLFFGLVRVPDDTQANNKANGVGHVKLFSYRPYNAEKQGVLSGLTDKVVYDLFESFEVLEIRNENPQEDYASGVIEQDKPADAEDNLGNTTKVILQNGVMPDSDDPNHIIAGNMQLNVTEAMLNGNKGSVPKSPLQTYLSNGSSIISKVKKKTAEEFFYRANKIGKISKALGDPNFSVGNVFMFEGTMDDTGYYVATEVTHTWNLGGYYYMDIVGVTPYSEKPLPKNAKSQNSIVVVQEKQTTPEELEKGSVDLMNKIESDAFGITTGVVNITVPGGTQPSEAKDETGASGGEE